MEEKLHEIGIEPCLWERLPEDLRRYLLSHAVEPVNDKCAVLRLRFRTFLPLLQLMLHLQSWNDDVVFDVIAYRP